VPLLQVLLGDEARWRTFTYGELFTICLHDNAQSPSKTK
jgi:hypothetical protein